MAVDAFIGELMPFSGVFAVRNHAECRGQLLSIAQFQAMFSILGTYYGGDGRTSFGLPDLRGRSPISYGSGPGLSNYIPGMMTGSETIQLTHSQLPAHTHLAAAQVAVESTATATMSVAGNGANATVPTSDSYIGSPGSANFFSPTPFAQPQLEEIKGPSVAVSSTAQATVQVESAGSSTAVDIRSPVQAISWQVCLFGTYPSRAD
ncbi:phage tail protein [Pseudoalteromonas rubra]|uniref:phage tail protein n=1 Tax=Pseudoalteromonas rubra TaxID=43658 RepID=UPI000F789D39|nr:tail fiber protein [Pseudoalteromonas rubra]